MDSYEVEERNKITEVDFNINYLNKKPVLIKGGIDNLRCTKEWSLSYFGDHFGHMPITTKHFAGSEVKLERTTMKEYTDMLLAFTDAQENSEGGGGVKPPYCHDVPVFNIEPNLIDDVREFPIQLLPSWYQKDWWRFVQFFMSIKGSTTPLHFDTLMTHNWFFQIVGKKRFTLIRWEDRKYCYRERWRWFRIDPENPDLEKYPKFRKAKIAKVDVEAGDMFYIPKGTLHQVYSLDFCISFNIDFHDKESLLMAIKSIPKGMPIKNIYYNFICTLGVVFKVPSHYMFRFYKSYLSYTS